MLQKTKLAALLLGAATLLSPLAWGQDTQTKQQDRVHSTKSAKIESAARSDWISFKDALKKLEDEGHEDIISLTQTRRGYYARTVNKDGQVEHIIIHPTEGTLSTKGTSDLRHNRHGRMYHDYGKRMHRDHGKHMHRGDQRQHPHGRHHGHGPRGSQKQVD